MAIRKSIEETLVVSGDRNKWLENCQLALDHQGFSRIEAVHQLGQINASYKKITVWGSIVITLRPIADDATEMHMAVTANVDNFYAFFRSPTRKILNVFKAGLDFEEMAGGISPVNRL